MHVPILKPIGNSVLAEALLHVHVLSVRATCMHEIATWLYVNWDSVAWQDLVLLALLLVLVLYQLVLWLPDLVCLLLTWLALCLLICGGVYSELPDHKPHCLQLVQDIWATDAHHSTLSNLMSSCVVLSDALPCPVCVCTSVQWHKTLSYH